MCWYILSGLQALEGRKQSTGFPTLGSHYRNFVGESHFLIPSPHYLVSLCYLFFLLRDVTLGVRTGTLRASMSGSPFTAHRTPPPPLRQTPAVGWVLLGCSLFAGVGCWLRESLRELPQRPQPWPRASHRLDPCLCTGFVLSPAGLSRRDQR